MEGVRLSSEFWRAAVERRCGGRCRLAADAPADEAESDLTRTGRSLGTLLLIDPHPPLPPPGAGVSTLPGESSRSLEPVMILLRSIPNSFDPF